MLESFLSPFEECKIYEIEMLPSCAPGQSSAFRLCSSHNGKGGTEAGETESVILARPPGASAELRCVSVLGSSERLGPSIARAGAYTSPGIN